MLDDAQQLRSRLGANDRRKIDEYLTAVRELELRITQTENAARSLPATGTGSTHGHPRRHRRAHPADVRPDCPRLSVRRRPESARSCTPTRAATGTTRRSTSPKDTTTSRTTAATPEKHEKLKIINRFHIEQFAYLLGKLKSIPEGAGSLLDNAMIVYGSGISDGDRHNHDDLPILLCGKGGGTIKTGRHLKVEPQPLNNLYLSMLDRMGAPLDRLGDSTGRLTKLQA